MRIAKVVLGLFLILALGGLVAGVASLVKKGSAGRPVTLDSWPDVPRKPAPSAP